MLVFGRPTCTIKYGLLSFVLLLPELIEALAGIVDKEDSWYWIPFRLMGGAEYKDNDANVIVIGSTNDLNVACFDITAVLSRCILIMFIVVVCVSD